ncbi:MAG: helix-turn-helix domain-containing protein [Desulfobacterales bacterium]|nr:helix-turn-helix domain-containing protein [Desulfobacterales bacterium]
MIHFTFLAENDCLSSGITGTIDAFSVANIYWQVMMKHPDPLFTTDIVTPDGKMVKTNGGIMITPDKAMEDITETDLVVIPGLFRPFDIQGERFARISQWLKSHYDSGTRLASTCTGTFLLGRTGLLDNKIATTNWQYAALFKKSFPLVDLRINRIFTEDSGIYCAGAATAFMDLCLYFIKKYGTSELAKNCAKSMLVDHDREEQTPYMVQDFWKNHSDEIVLNSQLFMEDNFSKKISIDSLSKELGLSPRHFKRRFKKATGENPLAYLQLLRVEQAKKELETTQKSFNEITWDVGYEEINSFRKLFKKHTGMSPKEYRKRFSWS